METSPLANGPAAELRTQWTNPGDVLSLLLLVGGDVVQKAIAQLVGVSVQPLKKGPRLYLTPVALSFGWVAYGFMALQSAVGGEPLMPQSSDGGAIVVNCKSGYSRKNRSWLLDRMLRDYETQHEIMPGDDVSLRIDIFEIKDSRGPEIDKVWIFGWAVMALQFAAAAVCWGTFGDWGPFLVTACGTFLALLTGGLRQWHLEKWPGRRLNTPAKEPPETKTVCLTRGHGHRHAMVLVASGTAWDLEAFATAVPSTLPETPWVLVVLAVLWTLLLISVAGLKQNAWFLVGIGGAGTLQNILASDLTRSVQASGFRLQPYRHRPTIIGRQGMDRQFGRQADAEKSDESADERNLWLNELDNDEIPGVRGALRELEKLFPKAGIALMLEFFPATQEYVESRYRTKREKKFWKRAFRRIGRAVPQRAPAVNSPDTKPALGNEQTGA